MLGAVELRQFITTQQLRYSRQATHDDTCTQNENDYHTDDAHVTTPCCSMIDHASAKREHSARTSAASRALADHGSRLHIRHRHTSHARHIKSTQSNGGHSTAHVCNGATIRAARPVTRSHARPFCHIAATCHMRCRSRRLALSRPADDATSGGQKRRQSWKWLLEQVAGPDRGEQGWSMGGSA